MPKSLILTITGFVGFAIACVFLFGTSGNKKSQFHEIIYDPIDVTRAMLAMTKDSITRRAEELDSLIQRFGQQKPTKAKKQGEIQKWQDSIIKQYSKDTLLLQQIESKYFTLHRDSTKWRKANESLRADINLGTLLALDTNYIGKSNNDTLRLDFTFKDTELKIETNKKPILLPIKNDFSDIDFFSTYPAFGFWAFMIILFITCVLMTIPYCWHAAKELSTLAEKAGCSKNNIYWYCLPISLGLITIFVGAIIFTLYDCDAIKNIYFMKELSWKVRVISIAGYIGAAFCFAGMLAVARYAGCFLERIPPYTDEQKRMKEDIDKIVNKADATILAGLRQKEKVLRLSRLRSPAEIEKQMTDEITSMESRLQIESDAEKLALLRVEISGKRNQLNEFSLELADIVNDYLKLRRLFRRFFYAISLLLALLVLSTGALYSAVDGLTFMQLIKRSLGFPTARPDFVYLYGALHTLLILLFYLPARFQLGANPVTSNAQEPEGQKSTFIKNLGPPMRKLPEILVATSPLLASLVQWIISLIVAE